MKGISHIIIFVVALLCAEFLVRAVGHSSPEGEFSLGGVVAKPYVLPWERIEKNINEYLSRPDSRVMYDATLGWRPRAGARSKDGLYQYDQHGVRVGDNHEERSREINGCTVILIGDSVTHGDELPYEKSWGAQLEGELKQEGVTATMVNLGMSGYAIDQALLRLKQDGAQFKPDLVLFGFQPENIKRDLSLSRVYYTHGADQIPFYKPRFIRKEGELMLIGTPTTSPDQILIQLRDPQNFPWIQYERFYKQSDYEMRWWRGSKIVALLESFITESNRYTYEARERELYSVNSESGALTLKLIEEMKSVSEAQGARFAIVYLPFEYYLQQQRNGKLPPYEELLKTLPQIAPLFRSDTVFSNLPINSQKMVYIHPYGYHLASFGGEVLSVALTPWIKELLPSNCTKNEGNKLNINK